MLGFLKPRHIKEAEAYFAQAVNKHQQLRLVTEDPYQLRALSAGIVQDCVHALRRDSKYGDAYILVADAISFWADAYAMQQDRDRALELLSMASFALQKWSTNHYFARNAARGRQIEERLLQIAYFTRPDDPSFFDPKALDAKWGNSFFLTGDVRFLELVSNAG